MFGEHVDLDRPQNRRRLVQLAAGATAFSIAGISSLMSRSADAQDDAPWSYEGESGPDHWGELDPDYATCSTGTTQSPIDITDPAGTDLANLDINYQPVSPMVIVNNGHTIEITVDPGNTLALDGTEYGLEQFHFHQPSEHTIDGEHMPLEMHLVHKTPDGAVAVVSVLFKEGMGGEPFEPIFSNLPTDVGTEHTVDVEIDLPGLLPAAETTYRYVGSLTTPPCTEGVQWLIFTEPVELSTEQIATVTSLQVNNRPVQPPNDRPVDEDTSD